MKNQFLKASLLVVIASLLSPAAPLEARSMLNPLNWFRTDARPDFSTPTPEQVMEAEQLYLSARAAQEDGFPRRALRSLKTIHVDYPNTPRAPDAYLLAGEIEYERGRWNRAFRNYRRIVERYPGHEKFDDVIHQQWRIANRLMDGERSRLLWVIPAFRQPRTAMEYFEHIIENAPFSRYAPQAQMNIALIAQSIGDEELAIDALDRLITFYPRSHLVSEAYLMLALVLTSLIDGAAYDQGSTLEAINYYEDFLILFPNSRYVEKAEVGLESTVEIFAQSKLMIGDFYYVYRKNNAAAEIFFNEVISVAPESRSANFARKRLQAIEDGDRRPFLSRIPSMGELYDDIDAFFEERWERRDRLGFDG